MQRIEWEGNSSLKLSTVELELLEETERKQRRYKNMKRTIEVEIDLYLEKTEVTPEFMEES